MIGSDAAPLLSLADVKAKPDLTSQRVEVPEWGGAVMVKVMKADEKLAWEKSCQIKRRNPGGEITVEANPKINVRVSLAVKCCVTADGAPMFGADDMEWLGQKSAAALERIFDAACALNRIGKSDVEELSEEDEEKNS